MTERKAESPAPTVAEKVEHLLETYINPIIADHGGRAQLVEVKEKTAYLRLMGGCQGCSSSSATLRMGIEKAIKERIPEIEEIVDVTDHAAGTNPYLA